MADADFFYGIWKVVEVKSLTPEAENPNSSDLNGVEFQLDDSGEITWNVTSPNDTIPVSLFSSEIYEITTGEDALLKLLGSDTIEFKVSVRPDDALVLNYENYFLLVCEKISAADKVSEAPFSLLNALEQGYFSDMTIKADNGTEFKVHNVVLKAACPEVDWSKSPAPLAGLPCDVVETVLHYIYSESLPCGLSEDTARLTLKMAARLAIPSLEKLEKLCEAYLKNSALKQQITSLAQEIHVCLDQFIDTIGGRGPKGNQLGGQSTPQSLTDPPKFAYALKTALRDAAVAGAKFLMLCHLFNEKKDTLSREERHEIIRYARTRLPVFLSQMYQALDTCRQQFSQRLCPGEMQEIATYIIPEIELALGLLSDVVINARTAIEHVIMATNSSQKHKKNMGLLGRTLRNALHMKEVMKLRKIHDKATESFVTLLQKKDAFDSMTTDEKVQAVVRSVEHFLEDLPIALKKTGEVRATLDEKLSWKEWKFMFKFSSSKVAWVLNKMAAHKSLMKTVVDPICDLVQREVFTATMIDIGLMDKKSGDSSSGGGPSEDHLTASAAAAARKHSSGGGGGATDRQQPLASGGDSAMPAVRPKSQQLSVADSLCNPPGARSSTLAKNLTQLLQTGELTDMCFEVVHIEEELSDLVIDHTLGAAAIPEPEKECDIEVREFRAHKTVVASRCDWFRRALLSGMKESINNKILVPDTDPELFKKFMHFVYSGTIDSTVLTLVQLSDLMSLSDRYEVDCLKQICENEMKSQIDDETAFYLLSLADQYNARTLRGSAMDYVKQHPKMMHSDIYEELPEHLQSEVGTILSCNAGPRGPSLTRKAEGNGQRAGDTTRIILNESDTESDGDNSTGSDLDLSVTENQEALEVCIGQLRNIIGPDVPREEMVRVSLAADYDVNRALNFFFSSE